jgi:hypothetical protein
MQHGPPRCEVDLFVIDEIGKMECFSRTFVNQVGRLLDGNVPVLATVAMKGGGIITAVKQRSDVELVRVQPRRSGRRLGREHSWRNYSRTAKHNFSCVTPALAITSTPL